MAASATSSRPAIISIMLPKFYKVTRSSLRDVQNGRLTDVLEGRRLPKLADLKPLIRARPIQFDPTERRLSRALTVDDLRAIARRRTPRAVFDYVDGAAETETSLRRAREAFGRVEFIPRVLHDVYSADPSTTLLGRRSALPLSSPRPGSPG